MADNSKQIEQMEEELKVDKNSLLGKWRNKAYDQNADKGWLKRFWDSYFQTEKGIYQQLLADPDAEVRGTVKELAEKYAVPVETMVGFLDGINDSLVEPNPIETMDEERDLFRGAAEGALSRAEEIRHDREAEEDRKKRSVSLRKRQEVQALLRQISAKLSVDISACGC